jgi:hypothetical protein
VKLENVVVIYTKQSDPVSNLIIIFSCDLLSRSEDFKNTMAVMRPRLNIEERMGRAGEMNEEFDSS